MIFINLVGFLCCAFSAGVILSEISQGDRSTGQFVFLSIIIAFGILNLVFFILNASHIPKRRGG
jgi:hypothetical protein